MKSCTRAGFALSLVTVTVSCGGGLNPGSPEYPPPPPPGPTQGPSTVTGSISGLRGSGLVLANAYSGGTLVVDPGATTLSLSVPGGYYNIVAISSPLSPAQACTVSGGMGYVGAFPENAPPVTVECTSEIGMVRGDIIGLKGSGLQLVQSNGDVIQPVPGDTDFTFATGLSAGMRYSVGIGRQPVEPAQTCTIQRGKGAMPGTLEVRDIAIECLDNHTSPLWGTYGFELPSGATGYMTFFSDGTYSYVVRMDDPACGENEGNGVEYGVYRWDAGASLDPSSGSGSGPFSILSAVVDTNGDCGLARSLEGSAELLTGTLDRSAAGTVDINTGDEVLRMLAVDEIPGQLIGSFEPGTVRKNGDGFSARVSRVSGAFAVFTSDGRYVSVETQEASSDAGAVGAEWGCATWSPYVLTQTCAPEGSPFLDLNGTGGLSERFRYGYGDIGVALAADWIVMNSGPAVGYMDYFWGRISNTGS